SQEHQGSARSNSLRSSSPWRSTTADALDYWPLPLTPWWKQSTAPVVSTVPIAWVLYLLLRLGGSTRPRPSWRNANAGLPAQQINFKSRIPITRFSTLFADSRARAGPP